MSGFAFIAVTALSLVVQGFGLVCVAKAEEIPVEESVVTEPAAEAAVTVPNMEVTSTEPVLETVVVEPPATPSEATAGQTEAVPQTTVVVPTEIQGPISPTGASAPSYSYNDSTGMWESEKYIWNPVTKQTTPKQPVNYSYNPTTGKWDTTEWIYSPESKGYIPNTISVSQYAIPDIVANPTSSESLKALVEAGFTPEEAVMLAKYISNGGPNGNAALSDPAKKHRFDLFYNVFISNNIDSLAKSGNAEVSHNTTGGSAVTGEAETIANIFNVIQSSWGFLGISPTIFLSNIVGNVVGDILLDPSAISTQNQVDKPTPGGTIDLKYDANNQINNTINLTAQSGNALVQDNTTAGDASSGNALALANVINLINSNIGSGQSFLGMINIQGNLNGDILLPEQTLTNLLNGTTKPVATLKLNNSEVSADFTNNQSINNQVTVAAATGNANVNQNTSAGNATTGQATTSVNIFNLTGREVIGSNALFVFVNVMGSWLGMIVDAPAGTTSSMIGGGSTYSTPHSLPAGELDVNANMNNQINNNINVQASSGNATVNHNTKAGNATTGDAWAGVNLLNINNSSFTLTDWFGILFINVFGNWIGSFGVNTSAGEVANEPTVTTPMANNSKVPKYITTNTSQHTTVTNVGSVLPSGSSQTEVLGIIDTVPPTKPTNNTRVYLDFSETPWWILIIFSVLAASVLSTFLVARNRASKQQFGAL